MAGERPELRGLLRVLLCPSGPSNRFRARRERAEVAAVIAAVVTAGGAEDGSDAEGRTVFEADTDDSTGGARSAAGTWL